MTKLKAVRPDCRELSNMQPLVSQPVYWTVRFCPLWGMAPVPGVMSPYCRRSAVVVSGTVWEKLSTADGAAVQEAAGLAGGDAWDGTDGAGLDVES